MTCNHAHCHQEATTRCRMGDGWIRLPGYVKRQTYAYYCDVCFQLVGALFRLCDVALIDRPFGPWTRPDSEGRVEGLRVGLRVDAPDRTASAIS